jgi:hypothetical protein
LLPVRGGRELHDGFFSTQEVIAPKGFVGEAQRGAR